jgi:hypothetical protein
MQIMRDTHVMKPTVVLVPRRVGEVSTLKKSVKT